MNFRAKIYNTLTKRTTEIPLVAADFAAAYRQAKNAFPKYEYVLVGMDRAAPCNLHISDLIEARFKADWERETLR